MGSSGTYGAIGSPESVPVQDVLGRQLQLRIRDVPATAEGLELPIEQCDVKFRYKCPKKWDELKASETPGTRCCEECKESVFLVTTHAEMDSHYRQRHCIAIQYEDEIEEMGEIEPPDTD